MVTSLSESKYIRDLSLKAKSGDLTLADFLILILMTW